MNIATAKCIPLREILASMGTQPAKERAQSLYYLSPWRSERTPSFHVSIGKNLWYDHGEGIGGDVISFACTILEKSGCSHRVADGLAWLESIHGTTPPLVPVQRLAAQDRPSVLELRKLVIIKHPALVRYLSQRGIPLYAAQDLLEEASLFNAETGRTFSCLAMKNDDDGFELRNQFFKGCLRPKTVTFIRGSDPNSGKFSVFEGMMDYLSIIARQGGRPFAGDTIILNSLSCLKHAFPYIRNCGYRTAYSWFDNDAAGRKSAQLFDAFLKTEHDLQHKPMNPIYAPFKDVNEWHMATPRP